MKLQEVAQHKGVQFGALVALLMLMTQFNTGLKLIYSKWTADEAAAEARKVAEEAKGTAVGVDARFDQYIQQQQQAIETQNKIAEAIAGYAAQQQHVPNQMIPQGLREYDATTDILWCCELTDRQACFDQNQWYHCE